jgi:hypothetical protein
MTVHAACYIGAHTKRRKTKRRRDKKSTITKRRLLQNVDYFKTSKTLFWQIELEPRYVKMGNVKNRTFV